MSLTKILLAVVLASAAAAQTCTPAPPVQDPGVGVPPFWGFPPHPLFHCGKTDVISTGLPPNHPLVIAQGYNPSVIAASIAADKANILKAGYNIKVVLYGPEQPASKFVNSIFQNPSGVRYEAATVGFGVRGAPLVNVTAEFENDISIFRQYLPDAPIGFSTSPTSTLAALRRVAPIQGNCTNTPGKDYGVVIYCAPNVCTVPYNPQIGTTYP